MQRLTEDQLHLLHVLGNRKLSLRKIQQRTHIPLSTIQYNLNRDSGRKRIKEIKLPSSDFIKGELVGAFAGDGNYFHDRKNKRVGCHKIRYYLSYNNDKDYAVYLKKLLCKMGLNAWIFIKKKNGRPSVFEVTVNSVRFAEFLKNCLYWQDVKTYSVRLKESINYYNKNFLRGFARGLMDTDGFVEVKNVSCGVVSEKLIENLRGILLMFSINPKVTVRIRDQREKLYLLRVPRRYLETYYDTIGFSNLRKKQRLLSILEKNGATRI